MSIIEGATSSIFTWAVHTNYCFLVIWLYKYQYFISSPPHHDSFASFNYILVVYTHFSSLSLTLKRQIATCLFYWIIYVKSFDMSNLSNDLYNERNHKIIFLTLIILINYMYNKIFSTCITSSILNQHLKIYTKCQTVCYTWECVGWSEL